jgi:heme/copper-type cytochrome/quinol oxidase subunit 1
VDKITQNIYLSVVNFFSSFFKNFIKLSDVQFFFSGVQTDFTNFLFFERFKIYLNRFNDLRKYFLKKYVYTINHKRIALNYFYFSMITGLSGAALATMIRLELAYPGSTFFKGDSLRYLQVITAHGLIMVFFVVVPILFGGFANFFIPYHIGSKDVAFPRLNSIGFWIQPCGWLLIAKTAFLRPQFWRYYDKPSFYSPLLDKSKHRKFSDFKENSYFFNKSLKNFEIDSFFTFWKPRKKINYENYSVYSFIPNKLLFWTSIIQYPESFWYVANKAVKARRKKVYFTKCSNRTLTMSGWVFITPFSSNTKFTGVGSQDIAVLSVIFAGVSTTISFTNLLITRRTLSMPGLRNRRALLPFITISLFLTMRMLALVTPVLGAAMIMLLLDRHWQTTFFEFVYGGDTVLFQHLFWFFGHPEVYILIIPTFGIMNMILPYSNTRRIASKHHMVWAIYMMAYMGFVVWGHHMYLVGLDHRSRALYSTITVMISLPATVKIVNWTLTLLNGALKWDVPFVFALAYMLLFLSGGLTGMWLSHVGLNVSMHDTFYVIAHFHLMLSGATVTGCFAGIYYYFPALFGVKYSRMFGYLHLIYYFGGQWMTFVPMFWLGYSGMPRRIHDYPAFLMGWHGMASVGHLTTLIGVMFFFLMLLDSHIERRVAVHNTLGIPRWHKRVLYYVFKIRYLQYTTKKLTRLPNSKVRLLLSNPYFNEFEIYKTK